MNPDTKELIETGIVSLLIAMFLLAVVYCVKWGVAYQTLVLVAGFLGTLIGALANKMHASGNGQSNGNGSASPKASGQ